MNIVSKAVEQGIDIIAITDHNSTRQCRIVMKEAQQYGITLYPGVEITTREEIHCLAYFPTLSEAEEFQEYLDEHLPFVKNDPALFGYQVVVDEYENIVFEEEKLLLTALNTGIDQIIREVHDLNGIIIPAHVNKQKDSIISQLGFIPQDLQADAFEITRHINRESFISQNKLKADTTVIKSSDAHMVSVIGENPSYFEMESTEFSEFRLALKSLYGRKVVLK